MMRPAPASAADRRPSGVAVALLISVLAHMVALTLLISWMQQPEPEPVRPTEVVLLSEEEQSTPDPEPKPEPETEPKPPRPERKPAAEPAPRTAQATTETAGPSVTEPIHEPLALAPEPSLPHPEDLTLDLDWNRFEEVFGDTAVKEREEYHQESQDRRRGGLAMGSLTGRVKRALENNRSWVAEGRQEPLGDRQKTFANYLHRVHDRFHHLFADDFLGSLNNLDPAHPLNNMSLSALMEFEIFKSGSISEIRVIRSSGNTVFDAAAVDSLYRGAPYPAAPQPILSWNDRVYFRWGFFRNMRKCGVFNAEPYILSAPGSAPAPVAPTDLIVDDG